MKIHDKNFFSEYQDESGEIVISEVRRRRRGTGEDWGRRRRRKRGRRRTERKSRWFHTGGGR